MVDRVDPTGMPYEMGYRTLIAFAADPDVQLWEKTVKPPGIDGGDAIDTTTMHNDVWRSFALRALKTLTEASFTAGYKAEVYDQVVALVNVPGLVTLHFPDSAELDFYGGLRTFEPNELSEEEQPEATCNITCTNVNPATDEEVAPDYRGPSS